MSLNNRVFKVPVLWILEGTRSSNVVLDFIDPNKENQKKDVCVYLIFIIAPLTAGKKFVNDVKLVEDLHNCQTSKDATPVFM